MKKFLFSIATLFFAISMAVAQQYDVRLNLTPNVKVPFKASTFTETEVNIPMKGVNKTNQTANIEFVFSIMEKKGDNYVINCVINKYEVSINTDGKEQKFSAADTEKSEISDNLKKVTSKIVQAEITPYFVLVGQVKPISEGLDQKDAEKIYEIFDDFLGRIYPEQPIEKGKTVEKKKKNKLFQTTLADVNENFYIMEQKWNVDENLQGVPMKGIGSMSYEIHRETGIPINLLTTLPLEGSVASPIGNVSIKVKTTSTVSFMQE